MARVEPSSVDHTRWPELAPPERDRGGVRSSTVREIRDAFRAAIPEMGLRVEFPDDSSIGSLDAPTSMVLRSPEEFFTRLASGATVGVFESYMAGEWVSGDLPTVLSSLVPWLARHPELESARRHKAERQGRRRAQQGAKNSDLEMGIPGDLVALYTDATMATSAALFASGARNQSHDRRGRTVVRVSAPTSSPHRLDLGDAQRRAHELLLSLAGVGEDSRVIVAPPGWGELPLRAAERGAQVRSVTESIDRLHVVGARVQAAGQSHAVSLSLGEFESLGGAADAIVIAEPHAATREGIAVVAERSSALLDDGGRLALQVDIGSDSHEQEISELTSWRRRYVDERSAIPLRSDLKDAFSHHPELRLRGRMEFGEHAAHTARLWRENFTIRGRDAAAQGFDPVFRRMWQLHLAAMEASYRSGWVDVWQLLASREPRHTQR